MMMRLFSENPKFFCAHVFLVFFPKKKLIFLAWSFFLSCIFMPFFFLAFAPSFSFCSSHFFDFELSHLTPNFDFAIQTSTIVTIFYFKLKSVAFIRSFFVANFMCNFYFFAILLAFFGAARPNFSHTSSFAENQSIKTETKLLSELLFSGLLNPVNETKNLETNDTVKPLSRRDQQYTISNTSPQREGEDENDNWGYDNDGNGPANWPRACQLGLRQSPIDIDTRRAIRVDVPRLWFKNYGRYFHNISAENNGHSVVFSGFNQREETAPYVYGGNLNGRYILSQFHFHWSHRFSNGSEHTINKHHYPVEVHMVHVREGLTFQEALNVSEERKKENASENSSGDGGSDNNNVLVLAVLGMIGEDGVAFKGIAEKCPNFTQRGKKTTVDFEPWLLLPSDTSNFYRYAGSLTTPGCIETVDWIIFHEPISITVDQLSALRIVRLSGSSDSDTRPVQPINGRKVLECFAVEE